MFPLVELHVDTPDTVLPLENVTDHVLSVESDVAPVPATDGSKIMAVWGYQILTRLSGAMYILSAGVTLNASYHASIWGKMPFTRLRANE